MIKNAEKLFKLYHERKNTKTEEQRDKIQKQIDRLTTTGTPHASHCENNDGFYSVFVEDEKTGFCAWIDCWIDEKNRDFITAWNAYIFALNNSQDVARMLYQQNTDNFEKFTDCATAYLFHYGIIMQDVEGFWFWGDKICLTTA